MKNFILSFLIGLLIFSGTQASDQAPRNRLWNILAGLRHRAVIRFQTPDSALYEGEFLKVQKKQLFYLTALGEKQITLDSINVLWVRKRATQKGAKKGLLYGAIAGAISFHLLGYLAYGMCEGDCPDDPFLHAMKFSLVGTILGGGSGALIGTIIGSGTYLWEKKFDRFSLPAAKAKKKSPAATKMPHRTQSVQPATRQEPPPPPKEKTPVSPPRTTVQPTAPSPQYIASMGARMGLGVGLDPETGGGSAIGIVFQTRVNPLMDVALEGNYYFLGKTQESFVDEGREITVDYSNHVVQLGGFMQFFLLRHGFRPFFTGGLGFYSWRQSYLGFNLGVGLKSPLIRDHYLIIFETRWHHNLQHLGGPTPTFLNGGMLLQYTW